MLDDISLLGPANTMQRIVWICSTGNFPTEEAFTFSEWKQALRWWWFESGDPCNLHFMANLRAYVRWLMVTFLSPSIRNRLHAQHTKLWNIDFPYLKLYSGLALTKVPAAKHPFHQTKWKRVRHSETLVWPGFLLFGVNPDVTTIKAELKGVSSKWPIEGDGWWLSF